MEDSAEKRLSIVFEREPHWRELMRENPPGVNIQKARSLIYKSVYEKSFWFLFLQKKNWAGVDSSWIFCVKRVYGFCFKEFHSFRKSPPLSACKRAVSLSY